MEGMSLINSTTDNSSLNNGLEILARWGYLSRGVIYFIIGSMAILAAIGQGGSTEDAKGALLAVLSMPGGWILVAVLAAGLIGYSLWRICQAVADADNHGRNAKGLAIRAALLASGITHAGLAYWAGRSALGLARRAEGQQNDSVTFVSWLMSEPFGRWLVGIAGILIIAAGAAQFIKGYTQRFVRYLNWDNATQERLLRVCSFGLFARGVVFAIIGTFVVYAAIVTNPQKAGGLHEALVWIRQQPYGTWLYGITAFGLAAFGVYSFVEARYRQVRPPL